MKSMSLYEPEVKSDLKHWTASVAWPLTRQYKAAAVLNTHDVELSFMAKVILVAISPMGFFSPASPGLIRIMKY